MIPAYDELYLDCAQVSLGCMLDFAVYELKYDIETFFQLFISSGVANRFGDGDFAILAGMSGVELAYKVLEESGNPIERISFQYPDDRSEEYWTGWALAYYQWKTALSFEEIVRYIPIKEIRDLYFPYHEMDIRQFCDKMDSFC